MTPADVSRLTESDRGPWWFYVLAIPVIVLLAAAVATIPLWVVVGAAWIMSQ